MNKSEMKNKSGQIEYVVRNNSIQKLFSIKNKTEWLKNENCIYHIASDGILEPEIDFQLCNNNQIRIKMKIHNSDKKDIKVKLKFPIVHNILIKGSYCYPSLNPQIGSVIMDYKMNYGTWFPLQFMCVFSNKKECLSLITQDTKNYQKSYSLSKKKRWTCFYGSRIQYTSNKKRRCMVSANSYY